MCVAIHVTERGTVNQLQMATDQLGKRSFRARLGKLTEQYGIFHGLTLYLPVPRKTARGDSLQGSLKNVVAAKGHKEHTENSSFQRLSFLCAPLWPRWFKKLFIPMHHLSQKGLPRFQGRPVVSLSFWVSSSSACPDRPKAWPEEPRRRELPRLLRF